jgi:hypothetical protein
MSTTEVSPKPTSAQDMVLDEIQRRRNDNTRKVQKSGLHAALGIGAYAAITILFPPASLLASVGALGGLLYGAWHGWDVVKDLGAEHSLNKAKKEAKEDPSFAKLETRAAKTKKWNNFLSNIETGVMAVVAVSALAILFAPAASVVAAVAAPLFSAALTVGLGVMTAESLAKGASGAANAVSSFAKGAVLTDKRAALEAEAAQLKSTLSVTNAPSPGASFDKAANGNTPPAADAPAAPPPALKQAPPQP